MDSASGYTQATRDSNQYNSGQEYNASAAQGTFSMPNVMSSNSSLAQTNAAQFSSGYPPYSSGSSGNMYPPSSSVDTAKSTRLCTGCKNPFSHPRRKYCDKCHEDCAKTPKKCGKCDQVFVSPNICRKFCDNCQKRSTPRCEELKKNCANCDAEFTTINSCRRYVLL